MMRTLLAIWLVVAVVSLQAGVFVAPASGEIILFDDFSNGSATDGDPATWHVPPQITIEDQSMVIRKNGLAFSTLTDSEFQNMSDISVRTQVRLLEGAVAGMAVRHHDGSANYNGGVFAPLPAHPLSQVAYLDRTDPLLEFGTTPVDFDITQQDVLLQIDAFGNQIKFWAWPVGTPMPTDPLFSVVDNAHDSGTIAMFAGSEDGDQLPAVAAFRYVLVADEHISEISADFDGDSDVDGNDFLAWQLGEVTNPPSAEVLALWEIQFGTTSTLSAAASIPEPSTLLLGVMVAMGLLVRRRSLR